MRKTKARKQFSNDQFWTGSNNQGDFFTWKWADGMNITRSDLPAYTFGNNCLAESEVSSEFKTETCCNKLPFVCESFIS
ncbi:hypothetical protein L596_019755 [Steinernema carpocapsae]|uniref:C-type lectin domain-containing protein n=1 Tax=Steinernema carpocapsae TaxID=34508 RepID=A0A4U5MS03_STECR|nr:hypothetical protein L596_019755 [Steinernema carpocapsae]